MADFYYNPIYGMILNRTKVEKGVVYFESTSGLYYSPVVYLKEIKGEKIYACVAAPEPVQIVSLVLSYEATEEPITTVLNTLREMGSAYLNYVVPFN